MDTGNNNITDLSPKVSDNDAVALITLNNIKKIFQITVIISRWPPSRLSISLFRSHVKSLEVNADIVIFVLLSRL